MSAIVLETRTVLREVVKGSPMAATLLRIGETCRCDQLAQSGRRHPYTCINILSTRNHKETRDIYSEESRVNDKQATSPTSLPDCRAKEPERLPGPITASESTLHQAVSGRRRGHRPCNWAGVKIAWGTVGVRVSLSSDS